MRITTALLLSLLSGICAQSGVAPADDPPSGTAQKNLEELLGTYGASRTDDPEDINRRYYAVVAVQDLGHSATTSGTLLLVSALADPDAAVSTAAARGLGTPHPGVRREAFTQLIAAATDGTAPSLRDAALATMIEGYPEETRLAMPGLLSKFDEDPSLAKVALALVRLETPEVVLRISRSYVDRSSTKPLQAVAMVYALAELVREGKLKAEVHSAEGFDILARALRAADPRVQAAALVVYSYTWYGFVTGGGAGHAVPADFRAALQAAASSPDAKVAAGAREVLRGIDQEP